MKNKNKKFRVELGLNLHAAPVPQTNANMRIFPLQNALIDITGGQNKPAWYSRLGTGDEISFRLVDISSLRAPTHKSDYPSLALAEFYFNNPATGLPTNPFTEEVVHWRLSDPLDDCLSPVYSVPQEQLLPTWDFVALSRQGEEFESLKFADCAEHQQFRAFELTVAIKMLSEGWVNHYVFDPEMIISETDSEDDKRW